MGKILKGLAIGFLIVCVGVVAFTPAAHAGEKVLKVGVIGPFTGGSARTGEEIKNTAKMAFESIGYKVGDYKIKLVYIDTQGDPAKAASAYSEAAERQGVQATICGWYSSVMLALMDLAAKYEIPNVGSMGGASSAVEKYKSDPKYKGLWMRGYPIVSKLSMAYVELLEDAIKEGKFKPKKKTVALYGIDNDWGREVVGGLKKSFSSKGWTIVSTDFFSKTQTDFYPLMGKYKKKGVAVLAGSSSAPAVSAAFIKQAAEIGVKSVIINDGLGWIGEWYKLTGKASNGVFDMIPKFGTKKAKAWAEAYKKKYGYAPGATASGLNHDNVHFFIKILRRTLKKYGELNKKTIRKVIVEEVCPGKLTYGQEDGAIMVKKLAYKPETYNDPIVGSNYWFLPVIQYMDGKSYIVYPKDLREKEPVFK